MFSKRDIEKELGKGINIYPLYIKNIKGNSVNFTVGRNAWTLGSGRVIKHNSRVFVLEKTAQQRGVKADNVIQINKGNTAILKKDQKSYVVLLPHTTTIVETSEVIGVSNYIGGTLHSKVGIVAQGVGAIGTMLGPNFAGHLMISLHNITDEVIAIPVGDTFISIIFYRLDTPTKNDKNPNISGHIDKLSELGISINKDTREYLVRDWKCNVNTIRDKMVASNEYKAYKKQILLNKCKSIRKYINLKNFILGLILVGILIAGWFGAKYLDGKAVNTVWEERYWTVVLTAIIVPILSGVIKMFKAE